MRQTLFPWFLVLAAGLTSSAAGLSTTTLPSLYEVEPNDTPAEATEISGEVILIGTMEGQDQDGFKWTVSDVDAQKRWTFELQGIPGRLTIVEVVRIEYADNGVDVAGTERLFKMGTRDGSMPSIHEDLLFEPGEYVLGVAHGGGGGDYRPPVDSVGFNDPGAGGGDSGEAGGYRLSIREGSRIHPEGQPKDRSTSETAFKLRLDSENAAYLETPQAWYLIELTEEQASQRWDLLGQVPVGRSVQAILYSGDGSKLSETRSDDKGEFALPDLGLEVGTYRIEVRGDEGGYLRALATESVGQRIEGAEAEPNDSWQQANRADLTRPVTGRMGKGNEADFFSVALDKTTVDQVLTLRLETATETQVQLCITDAKGQRLQCRKAVGVVELPDLVLTAGEWGVVAERGPEGAEYTVSLVAQGAISAGIEAEPNDTIETAAAVPSNNRIKGRFSGDDTDFFQILVTEEPQLWRFQVIGDEIHELAYNDGAGIQNQVYRVPAGQKRVRLDNVFLLPGVHHVRVTGRDGGSYTLLARAIGPPDPNGEFEPNDDTSRMQPLRFGQTRHGLLADHADSDNYRFYLGHWDRIRLTLEPPPDGEILAQLYWDKSSFKQFNRPQAGQKVVLEGLFPPGDYYLALNANTISESEYKLSLERLDRFGCPTDCEPNDNLDFASPLPPDHVLEGRASEWRDSDWYQLPVFDQSTEITLASEPKQAVQVVTRDYAAKNLVEWDSDTGRWRGTIPAGIPTYVQIGIDGPYRFEVDFPSGPQARPTPKESPIELAIELDTSEVGAYRSYGQQVAGKLVLTNRGSTPALVDLVTATSDYRWQVSLARIRVKVAENAGTTVPVKIHVPADAWSDRLVRISARATTAESYQTEAFIEIEAGSETTPINPAHGWTLPEELRGGFNVAWQSLGGRWVGERDTAIGSGFPYLFDGMAVENHGLQLRGGTQQHEVDVIVELASREPVEVVGLAINLLSGANAQQALHNLDFALSMDGEQFTPILEGDLLPIMAEQAFVLDRPVTARFARLRPKRAFDGAAGPGLGLGELKVIARPGIDISEGKGFNLADPTLGGHVAWSWPPTHVADWDSNLLAEPDQWQRVRLKPGQSQDFVIGFHHSRAAQIRRVEWQDGATAEQANKFRRVGLSVSLDSPIGPWRSIGEWNLETSGSSAVFELPEPVWARYVKFSATGGAESGHAEAPALIRIWERPTDEEYRSVLTEWGFASQAAIYEALHPLRVDEPFKAANHDSKASAAPLEFERLVGGQVVLGRHQHWYRVAVPASENTLTLSLGGDPTVRTVAHLENSAGEPIPIRKTWEESTPQQHVFEAVVQPGQNYYIRIEEPPRNVVFLWDTSASVGAYLPVIYNSMMAYAEDVVPGRDAANLMPFGGDLLLRDWYGEPFILQTVLNDYPRQESSSEAEGTLSRATKALAPRAGTKAIVVVTDAATNRYAPVWRDFDQVQPRIFGLGVGSQGALGRDPVREQDLMQDWSRVNGGHYSYLLNEGEMEIAFDRAATLLRRPAGYTLEVASAFREAPGPGSLTVSSAADTSSGSGAAIELILDASGSMLKRLDRKRRIAIAKEVLTEAVNKHIPAGTPVALRVFGHKEPNSCRTDLEMALAPLDPAAAAEKIQAVNAMNLAKTPIADSLAKVESDLEGATGRKIVVLVTDGEETCDGDPEATIEKLQAKGIEISLNIVGFAIDDDQLEAQFEGWADLGGGRYFSAKSQEGLQEALEEAVRIPFSVYDAAGTVVGEGVVGGAPLELDQGFYRVVVQTAPPRTFDNVEVPGEQEVELKLN